MHRVTKKYQPDTNPMSGEPVKRWQTTQPDANPRFWACFILHYPVVRYAECLAVRCAVIFGIWLHYSGRMCTPFALLVVLCMKNKRLKFAAEIAVSGGELV